LKSFIQAKFSNLEAGYKIGDPKNINVVSKGTNSAKSLMRQPINEKYKIINKLNIRKINNGKNKFK
tara:strand:+ start:168 stop:365 length:198 start_codon:yes stop_codon:yes gene_type:complete